MNDNFDNELLNEQQRQEAMKELCDKPDNDSDLYEQLKEEHAEKKLRDWTNSKDDKL